MNARRDDLNRFGIESEQVETNYGIFRRDRVSSKFHENRNLFFRRSIENNSSVIRTDSLVGNSPSVCTPCVLYTRGEQRN